jgi:hypothetical protein
MGPSLYGLFTIWAPHCMGPSLYGPFTVWAPHCIGPSLYGPLTVWVLQYMGPSLYGPFTIWALHCMGPSLYGPLTVWVPHCMGPPKLPAVCFNLAENFFIRFDVLAVTGTGMWHRDVAPGCGAQPSNCAVLHSECVDRGAVCC